MKARTLSVRLLQALGLCAVFTLASSSALVLHIGLPAGRRTLATALESSLDRALLGKFWIGSVERIDASGLVVKNVVVADPVGKRVLSISRLRIQADIPQLLYAIVFENGALTLVVDHLQIARAEAFLEDDSKSGQPSLFRAFHPRPDDSPPSAKPERAVRVLVRAIELRRGFARGSVFGLPILETDVSAVRGSLDAGSDGADLVVNRFAAVVRGLGGTDLRGIASLRVRTPSRVSASFNGYFGELQLGAQLALDGDQLEAAVEIPRARPADLLPLLPDYPLQADARFELTAAGTLPVVTIRAELETGDSQLLATGPLRLQRGVRTELQVEGRNVDFRLVFPELPKTQIDLRAHLDLDATRSPAVLTVDGSTEPTWVANLPLPRTDISGKLIAGRFEGTGFLHEPGMPTRFGFRVGPGDTAFFRAEVEPFRLEQAPRFAAAIPVRGLASGRVDIQIQNGKISAEAGANFTDLSSGPAELARGTLVGTFHGPLDKLVALSMDVRLAGSNLHLGGLPFTRLAGRIQGPLRRPNVQATLDGQEGRRTLAEAKLSPLPDGVRIEGLSVAVRSGEDELRGSASRVEVRESQLDFQEVELTGLGGSLRGSARLAPGRALIDAQGEKIDLAALSRLLGLATRPRGRVSFAADLVLASDVERGTASLELEDLAFGGVDGLTATAEARLEHGLVRVTARGELAGLGRAEAQLQSTLPGSALHLQSFRDMSGEATLSLLRLDAAFLSPLLARQGRTETVAGKLTVHAKLKRKTPGSMPELGVTGFTEDLVITRPPGEGGASTPIDGVNLTFGANLNGESGESDFSAQLVDPKGSLGAASVSGKVDWEKGLRNPDRLAEQLLGTPVAGKLLFAERSISDMPEWLRPPGTQGRARGEATLGGTLAEPKLSARLSLGAFGLEGARNQRPVDLCANLTFEPESAELASVGEAFLSVPTGERCTGERVLRYSLKGTANRDPAGDFRPRGTLSVGLEGFPLDSVPGLGDAGISGRAFGSGSLTDTDGILRLVTSVELRDTRVQGVPVGTGKLRLQSDERSIGATLALSQDGGALNATALGAIDRSRVLPVPDLRQPLFVRLTAHGFDAVVLSPVLRDVLSEIGGRVDADLTATLVQQSAGERAGRLGGAIQGRLGLEHGSVQLAGLGLRLSDVTLRARAEAIGEETRVTVEELRGRGGRTGERIEVRDGRLWLDGLRPVRAEGAIDTAELPLMLEGVAQATATTRQSVKFNLRREADRMHVDFDLPYLLVALPQSTGRDLISLDENASIEVLQPLGEPTRRSGEGLPWLLEFNLGQEVRLTRSDLDLPITGNAQVLLADEVSVTGDLELRPGGRLQVSDRAFVIESGEVHFNTGEAGNPAIRVTATWRAPDDTMVFATVSGTLKDPKLLPFSSSPSRSQEEIWALLLGYGGGDETPGAASALVGAHQLLAPVLQNTPIRQVTLRADEAARGDRSYTTYSAAVPIGDKVWFEGSYHSPHEGQEYKGAVSGTVDWRFRPHWSLRTEVGTIGTGLDLVWQYRY